MSTKPDATLARLTGKGADLAQAMKNKHFKRLVEKESRTSRLALQERRLRLEAINQYIGNDINELLNNKKLSAAEREQKTNMCNLLAMQGITLGLGLVVDSVTRVYTKTKRDPETGEMVSGKKRVSIAENLESVHDMMIDLLQLQDIDVNISNDIALRFKVWQDAHGVNRSPYIKDTDDPDAPEDLQKEVDDPDVVTEKEEREILGEEPPQP